VLVCTSVAAGGFQPAQTRRDHLVKAMLTKREKILFAIIVAMVGLLFLFGVMHGGRNNSAYCDETCEAAGRLPQEQQTTPGGTSLVLPR
jgi:hypothetical protein